MFRRLGDARMSQHHNCNQPFQRAAQLSYLTSGDTFDLLVIGGGATGAGIALDAASRGYKVALCEQHDFGKGTSSRSTKLVHGGVRYLEQGHVQLVRDALRERGLLRQNAPHLVYPLPTIVPLYRWWEPAYYRAGLIAYDLLAGKLGFGRSCRLSASATREALPTLNAEGLRGGVRYYDGGFDDARLLINLLQTAVEQGAVCVNYTRVEGFLHEAEKIVGVEVEDLESNVRHQVRAKVVVNAAGPYGDAVRRMADANAPDWIQPSQGIHLVLDRSFLPSEAAMIVPKTTDGRVVFAIPWHGHTLVGTTDTPLDQTLLEPQPLASEVDFLLETASRYLTGQPTRSDVLSVFAGLRPLVRRGETKATGALGRDHAVRVDQAGLVTMLGGKWTTYRKMAKDCVDRCAELAELPKLACRTKSLPIRCGETPISNDRLNLYGADASAVRELIASDPSYSKQLEHELPYTVGEAVWAVRHEMAQSVEDVLSRRLRALFLNAAAAMRAAPSVAKIIAAETEQNEAWIAEEITQFEIVAQNYMIQD